MRHKIGLVVSLLISAGLIIFLFRDIAWETFFETLAGVKFAYLPLFVVVFLLGFWLRAIRWRWLLSRELRGNLQTSKLFSATVLGFFASFILPLRAGEFVRPLVLNRLQGVSFSGALASVVVERVFDVLALLVFLGVVIAYMPEAPPLVSVGAKLLGGVAGAIVVLMLVSYFQAARVARFSQWFLQLLFAKRYPKLAAILSGMVVEFLAGLRAVGSIGDLIIVSFWSLVLWLNFSLLYQVGLWSLGEFPSFWVGLAVNVLIAIAIAVPSAPGFIGTFQLGCVLALTMEGSYSESFALSYSIFVHVLQMILMVILAAWVLRREKLGLKDVLKTPPTKESP